MSYYLGVVGVTFLLLIGCSAAQNLDHQSSTALQQNDSATSVATMQFVPNASLITAMKERNSALSMLDISASVNATLDGNAAPPANCTLTICRNDSLGMVFRAFGMPVGKLYARNDYFLFFDAFNNRALDGAPTAANIGRAINVPLSYQDFTHLLRGEAPGDIALFMPVSAESKNTIQPTSTSTLFQRKTAENGIEYALFSPDRKALVQYQRKAADGAVQLNVRYEDFVETNGVQIAKKVAISVPSQNSNVTFIASEITVNSSANKQLIFAIPSSVPKSRLE